MPGRTRNGHDSDHDMEELDEIKVQPPPSAKKQSARRASGTAKSRKPNNLACLNCRPRKIKCNRVDGACERCRTLNLPCKVPDRDERKLRYSKEYIEGLENEIAELKNALEQVRNSNSEAAISPSQTSESKLSTAVVTNNDPETSSPEKENSPSDSIIERVCGMKPRMNSNSDGQSRYFGPTSSLHFTETPDSISHYANGFSSSDFDIEDGIPENLQTYLLDLYWTYQHSSLPVVHKEAFLAGMEAGSGPYFSQCLLLCILASGARIAPRPQIRALSIPTDDVDKTVRRPLMKQAEDAMEKELFNPSITTIQSCLLLSVMHCVQSNDSRGWMLSGNACRLVFDLGLHQDWTYLSGSRYSQIDMEVRLVVFWGCFGLDRLWALYLGRPPFIKLTDVSIRRPELDARTWELKIFAAWIHLLDIAGQIGEKLNTNACSRNQIEHFAEALHQWESSLDPSLTFEPEANPSIYHLHMQYSAMTILLNRHNAGFGNEKGQTPEAMHSRQECLYHAFRISQMLQDYKAHHGEAWTLLGSALYNITMAATTFVAELFDSQKGGSSDELTCLMTCLRTMKEMEHTEIVAKNVYNIVQALMRVCNVGEETAELGSLSSGIANLPQRQELPQIPYDASVVGQNQTTLAMWPAFDFEGLDNPFPFAFEQPVMNPDSGEMVFDSMQPQFM